MEYSQKLTLTFALVFAMAAAVQLVTAARNAPVDYVAIHNAARAAVGVGPVTWNSTVAAYAQSYAEKRRGDCKLEHTPSPRTYGENLFGGRGGGAGWTAVDAVFSWVSEKRYYDHANNTCAAGQVCEHYTQVVWNTSTAIGCGRVVCDGDNDGVFIVCSYSPPGNVVGQSPY